MVAFVFPFLLMILVPGVLLMRDAQQFMRIRSLRKSELKESMRGNAVGEPSPYRLLIDKEVEILRRDSSGWQNEEIEFFVHLMFTTPLVILVTLSIYVDKIGQFPNIFLVIFFSVVTVGVV